MDSSGNLRSLRAANPYSVNINNNTDLVISGPPGVSVYGDDNTNGMKLYNTTESTNYVAKSLKAAGYLTIYPEPNGTNALVINTTQALQLSLIHISEPTSFYPLVALLSLPITFSAFCFCVRALSLCVLVQ